MTLPALLLGPAIGILVVTSLDVDQRNRKMLQPVGSATSASMTERIARVCHVCRVGFGDGRGRIAQ